MFAGTSKLVVMTIGAVTLFLGACAEVNVGNSHQATLTTELSEPHLTRIPEDANAPHFVLIVEPMRKTLSVNDATFPEQESESLSNGDEIAPSPEETVVGEENVEVISAAGYKGGGSNARTVVSRKSNSKLLKKNKSKIKVKKTSKPKKKGEPHRDPPPLIPQYATVSETINSQLLSALGSVANFRIIPDSLPTSPGTGKNRPKVSLADNEQGPFLIRSLITEYNAVVESDTHSPDGNSYQKGNPTLRGVVTIDFEVINLSNKSLVAAFPVTGTESSPETNSDLSLRNGALRQQVVAQAMNNALRETIQKLFEKLKSQVAHDSLDKASE